MASYVFARTSSLEPWPRLCNFSIFFPSSLKPEVLNVRNRQPAVDQISTYSFITVINGAGYKDLNLADLLLAQ